jgi:hypothetical protein
MNFILAGDTIYWYCCFSIALRVRADAAANDLRLAFAEKEFFDR